MRQLSFIYFFINSFFVFGQLEIFNLSQKGYFEGDLNEQYIKMLEVSFEVENSDNIQIIYLQYGEFDNKENESRIFDLRKKTPKEVNISSCKENNAKITITEIIPIKKFAGIEFIRIYVSDKTRRYSNSLIFEKN